MSKSTPKLITADGKIWLAGPAVICTHGRSRMIHLFLGSIAERLVRVARKLVLLTRWK